MNSVTSNAVATAGSYLNIEHFTGRYWIDGRPIFEKTIELTNPLVDWTEINITSSFQNLRNIVKTHCVFFRNDGAKFDGEFRISDNDRLSYIAYCIDSSTPPSQNVYFILISTKPINSVQVSLEYTRTTD